MTKVNGDEAVLFMQFIDGKVHANRLRRGDFRVIMVHHYFQEGVDPMARALRVLRVILAAATAAVCLLLCWQAVDIYLTGNSPDNFSAPGVRINPVYTRELVGNRLAAIAPVLFAYLALIVAGCILACTVKAVYTAS